MDTTKVKLAVEGLRKLLNIDTPLLTTQRERLSLLLAFAEQHLSDSEGMGEDEIIQIANTVSTNLDLYTSPVYILELAKALVGKIKPVEKENL